MIVRPHSKTFDPKDNWYDLEEKEYKVVKNYWYNGEGWYLMNDGTEYPDILFEEVK